MTASSSRSRRRTPAVRRCARSRAEIRRALEAQGFGPVDDPHDVLAGVDDRLDRRRQRATKLEAYGIAPPSRVDAIELVPLLRRAAAPFAARTASRSNTEQKSVFGTTACKSIWVCNACRQPFEEFKAI